MLSWSSIHEASVAQSPKLQPCRAELSKPPFPSNRPCSWLGALGVPGSPGLRAAGRGQGRHPGLTRSWEASWVTTSRSWAARLRVQKCGLKLKLRGQLLRKGSLVGSGNHGGLPGRAWVEATVPQGERTQNLGQQRLASEALGPGAVLPGTPARRLPPCPQPFLASLLVAPLLSAFSHLDPSGVFPRYHLRSKAPANAPAPLSLYGTQAGRLSLCSGSAASQVSLVPLDPIQLCTGEAGTGVPPQAASVLTGPSVRCHLEGALHALPQGGSGSQGSPAQWTP